MLIQLRNPIIPDFQFWQERKRPGVSRPEDDVVDIFSHGIVFKDDFSPDDLLDGRLAANLWVVEGLVAEVDVCGVTQNYGVDG